MLEQYFFAIEYDGSPIVDVKFADFGELYDFVESFDFSRFFGLESIVYSIDLRPAYGRKNIYFEETSYNGFRNKWNRFERDTY